MEKFERDQPTQQENSPTEKKKEYTPPVLKPYSSPKLHKHQSYKNITLFFNDLNPPVS